VASRTVEIDVARGDSISPPHPLLLHFLLGMLDVRCPLFRKLCRFLIGFLRLLLILAGFLVLFGCVCLVL
jgi:hypothetical protein